MDGFVIIISGPSGSGKNTIIDHLIKIYGGKLTEIVTTTTRKPRENEIHGIDYYFISLEEFQARVKAGDFVEYEEVNAGTWYGTYKSEFQKLISTNQIAIFDIDVKGAINIKKLYPQNTYTIFIKTPSIDILRDRIINRNDKMSEEEIQKRLTRAEFEYTFIDEYDQLLINDKLEETLSEAEKIVSEIFKKQN
jgi:guanylate kinase